MQAFRDQTYTNSLEFWRFVLLAPTLLKPLTSHVQDASFIVRSRPLDCVGLLRACDQQETNTRVLEAEWMSAFTVWDTCWHTIWPSSNRMIRSNKENVERIVLYFHGGAYCTMSAQTHRTLTHKISKATGRRCFVVNYRLAPETKFPGALYDAVQAYLHLIDPDDGYCFDPKRIMIMGDSAGGGLALAMMLYLRDHGLPSPEGACLLSPWVDLTFSYPSWDSASLFDYLPNNPDKLTDMNPQRLYLGDDCTPANLKHPYVSPLFADHFEHLPPIMIQSGGCESLRDEIDAIYQKINQSKTTFIHNEVYQDMVHVFQAFPFGKTVDEAIASIGWWARIGASMISKYQVKQQATFSYLPSSAVSNAKGLILSSFFKSESSPPLPLGRRHRSIAG
ncbi:alpha/beta hydrolase fold-domain-containing protein [Halteromyces radiatus]|uniref:alpha/beta hydrolase fold-domain-containing protein n=1 Tax=Halteromyces radiatus TaxID=101107 RepID=UPI00221E8C1F|nr:alpha/beta hydrolase fold-domain-containing protein [Halteromyces radiatus]KAI8099121.1 alpha/beta hydrolase fold-domain-containing protein [Halteromyces radiatus]